MTERGKKMNDIRIIIEVKESIFDDNNRDAQRLRDQLKEEKTFLLNLMSSPGSGKTSTLLALAAELNRRAEAGQSLPSTGKALRWAVMEADIDSTVDAQTMEDAGIPAIQIHTGGMCHLDADMTRQGLSALKSRMESEPDPQADLVILENVGNLVCPAEFDTGAGKCVMLLSVPEGDDKPLKYPLMFSTSDALLITKIDVLPYFDFDIEACKARARKLNPNIAIFTVSSKTGEGMEEWEAWLSDAIDSWKK